MKTDFKNILQLMDYFKSEDKCKKLLEIQRWGGKITCPTCSGEKIYRTNRGFKCGNSECYRKFTVTVGTVFENTKIKLRYWFAAIYLVTNHKKGISSHQLARDINVTQKTAWFMLHRIREMMQDSAPQLLDGCVEVDETYVGGKFANMKESKRKYLNDNKIDNKTIILGILQRNGKVITKVVPSKEAHVLNAVIRENVKENTLVVTDGYTGYMGLANNYHHESVNHLIGEYARGEFHTNSLEGFWSLLKRGVIGIYHSVSPKHLQKYSNEFAYRYGTRKEKDCDRFIGILSNASNFRITYNQLTNG